jgi:hypothetical protein
VHVPEQQSAAEQAAAKKNSVISSQEEVLHGDRQLELWLGETYESIVCLGDIYSNLTAKIIHNPEVEGGLVVLRKLTEEILAKLTPQVAKYGENKQRGRNMAHILMNSLFPPEDTPSTPYEVLETLRALHVYVAHIRGGIVALNPASQALWDNELHKAVLFADHSLERIQDLTQHQMKVRSPQTLLVPVRKGR